MDLGMILTILEVALALGFVIFVHELGHFALAKWAGVKVERFSIGFGPILWKVRRGETEYALSGIPFGGYVKMLGENPEEASPHDPRAYSSQPVGKRMLIISAGVIMNMIFGWLFFSMAFALGVERIPAVIGGTVPGTPAWVAGLQNGDWILAVNGTRNPDFRDVKRDVILSGADQRVRLTIQRDHQAPFPISLLPQKTESDPYPEIGINPSVNLVLDANDPVQEGTPAARAQPPLKGGDRIVAIQGVEVQDYAGLVRLLDRYRAAVITMTVQRGEKAGSGHRAGGKRVTVTIQPNYFRTLGLRLQMGAIAAIRTGSPAEKAQPPFMVGDRILKIDGKDDFDPMTLPDLFQHHAGRPVKVTVLRNEDNNQDLPVDRANTQVEILVTPDDRPAWGERLAEGKPMSVPGLGIAYYVDPQVVKVVADSPAAKQVHEGDQIQKVVITDPRPGTAVKPISLPLDDKDRNWPAAFWLIQETEAREVILTVKDQNDETRTVTLRPRIDRHWPLPLRGLLLQGLSETMPRQGLHSLVLGARETKDTVLQIYLTLRGLLTSRVPAKDLAGPIQIGKAAYDWASMGFSELLRFLGMLSVNLAVINFLPIPILDGGHMLFLLIEKVRGEPVSERTLIAANYFGLIVLLSLMLFVTFNDVVRNFHPFGH